MSSPENASGTSRRSQRLEDKLRRPQVFAEIAKTGSAMSGKAQTDFIDVLETTSDTFRNLLVDAALIQKTNIDNTDIDSNPIWQAVPGLRIGFVEGGIAKASLSDAASPAVRVGSCVVVPGPREPDRKPVNIDFEVHPVHELYQSAATQRGLYDDQSEDTARLMNAARIACEMGAILSLLENKPSPDVILLHGSLVYPVSPYASVRPGDPGAFPNFREAALPKLLAGVDCGRTGRDANFISVYLEQLNRMAKSDETVCGMVERSASQAPGILTKALLQRLKDESLIDLTFQRQFLDSMNRYGIGDTVLFECVLDEGEFAEPVQADTQEEGRIPVHWEAEIQSYPKPLMTYAKAHADMMPVRIEILIGKSLDSHQLTRLIIHMSRLT
jgi:hypothetical protein